MPTLTLLLASAAFLAALTALYGIRKGSEVHPPPETVAYDDTAVRVALDQLSDRLESTVDRLDALRADYKTLVIAVDEGIQNVRRRENRVKASVRRAQEELAEHGLDVPAISAEVEELRLLDGAGSEERQLQLLPEDVAAPPPPPPGVPGAFTAEELRALRGA